MHLWRTNGQDKEHTRILRPAWVLATDSDPGVSRLPGRAATGAGPYCLSPEQASCLLMDVV